ncbi:MAG: hypothetical protein SOR61_02515 [Evtepia sp.]|uniref:hypothetical protein n=1 Tax=Evtepia sp. TaxID=2773933 RepID=UPI002A7587FE|nr:hypothetical protein [Evtepia sp.]MDY3014066.1 hypothetical protein [Evtepia sp.]
MKKNETKFEKNKRLEVRLREQEEDRIFNKMLLWVAGAAIVEVIMLLINRFYLHARANEMVNGVYFAIHQALGFFLAGGVILFAVFLGWGIQIRKKAEGRKGGTLQFIVAAAFLCVGVGGFLMRSLGAPVAPMILSAVPGLAVLVIVFFLYQKEFFACVLVGGMGILGLWVFRVAAGTAMYYGYLALTLVVAAAGVVFALLLRKKDGVLSVKGRDVAILQEGAAYLAYYLTAVVVAVLLLAPLALGAAVAYYGIWITAAWLFILAVYFTSKLM